MTIQDGGNHNDKTGTLEILIHEENLILILDN